MKTLYLIRHAKSSWSIGGIEDRDRPLKGRGIRDAHLVSNYLRGDSISDEFFSIVSSPATRALHTALIFAKNFGVPASKVDIDERLYHSGLDGVVSVVKSIDPVCSSSMLFLHNPEITDFVNTMVEANIRNVPTTGFVAIRFDCNHWENIASGGELLVFEYPKRLKE